MTSFDAVWNEAFNEQGIIFIESLSNVLEVSQTGECIEHWKGLQNQKVVELFYFDMTLEITRGHVLSKNVRVFDPQMHFGVMFASNFVIFTNQTRIS